METKTNTITKDNIDTNIVETWEKPTIREMDINTITQSGGTYTIDETGYS